jgi:hypothetical protein
LHVKDKVLLEEIQNYFQSLEGWVTSL